MKISNQVLLDSVANIGRLELFNVLIFKLIASVITKFNPPNGAAGEGFIIYML
jgi:hypothetical protein